MNIAIVSSKGGHLGQSKLIFTDEFIGERKAVLITETEEEKRFEGKSFLKKYPTYFLKKDNLRFNILKYLDAFFRIVKILKKEKIDIVFTNGAQLSIPAVFAAKFLGIKVVFIETVIRVKTTTWSAKACYPLSDVFLVQHPGMAKKYGKKAKFIGGLI